MEQSTESMMMHYGENPIQQFYTNPPSNALPMPDYEWRVRQILFEHPTADPFVLDETGVPYPKIRFWDKELESYIKEVAPNEGARRSTILLRLGLAHIEFPNRITLNSAPYRPLTYQAIRDSFHSPNAPRRETLQQYGASGLKRLLTVLPERTDG